MRLTQQDVVALGEVSQSNLTRAVDALRTGLVEFAAVQRNLWISRVDRLAAGYALVAGTSCGPELLHAFLDADPHGGGFFCTRHLQAGLVVTCKGIAQRKEMRCLAAALRFLLDDLFRP